MRNIKEIFTKKDKKKYEKMQFFNKKEKIEKISQTRKDRKNKKQINKFDISKSNLKVITIILLFIIILILFLTGYSLSKSFSEIKINSLAPISQPVIVVDSHEKIKITEEKNTGEYHFAVQNYNESQINEALLQYKITIEANVDKSINFELYKDNEQIQLKDNSTDYINIGRNEKEKHNYILKIKYDKNKSQNIYDIIEKIQVKIHSEQKKT